MAKVLRLDPNSTRSSFEPSCKYHNTNCLTLGGEDYFIMFPFTYLNLYFTADWGGKNTAYRRLMDISFSRDKNINGKVSIPLIICLS